VNTEKKPVNVEKGKKGFQPRQAGAQAPTPADPASRSGVAVVVEDGAPDPDRRYGGAYEVFQSLRGVDPELLEAIEATQSGLDADMDVIADQQADYVEKHREFEEAVSKRDRHRDRLRQKRESWIADARSSIADAQEAAFRLYKSAGVNDRYARFFSNDIAEQAQRVLNTEIEKGPHDSRRLAHVSLLQFASRRRNFTSEVLAAAEAAKKDKQWQAAVKNGNSALGKIDKSRKDYDEINLDARVRELSDQARESRVTYTQTRKRIENQRTLLKDLRSRESSGVPLSTQLHRTHRDGQALKREIVRNPDGSTNAWVRVDSDDGERRYVPIVGVSSTTKSGTPVNALVTSDGEEIVGVDHVNHAPGSGRTRSATIVTGAPKPGAGLLADEGNPQVGYSVSLDTSG